MTEFEEIEIYLSNVASRSGNPEQEEVIRNKIAKLKKNGIARNDEAIAKSAWCYEQVLLIQKSFVEAFNLLKKAIYYDAWCLLERVEIHLEFLRPHLEYKGDQYKLLFVENHVKKYQAFFPYKYFASPEFLILEKICSVCKKPVSLRNFCGHRLGDIYNGEMCHHIINNAQLLAIGIVENPAQKYSVLSIGLDPVTGKHEDKNDYGLLRSLFDMIQSPFDAWDYKWTKIRHPHRLFNDVKPDHDCPCDSGKKYKQCCLKESGVLRPHCEVSLSSLRDEQRIPIKHVGYD